MADDDSIIRAVLRNVWVGPDLNLIWRDGVRAGLRESLLPLLMEMHQAFDVPGVSQLIEQWYADHEAEAKAPWVRKARCLLHMKHVKACPSEGGASFSGTAALPSCSCPNGFVSFAGRRCHSKGGAVMFVSKWFIFIFSHSRHRQS